MAKRSISRPRRKFPKSIARPPTRAEQRKAQDEVIQAGAFEKPLNRLVHRDPAETIKACRQAVFLLAHFDLSALPTNAWLGRDAIFQTVVDALQMLERDLAGFWAEGARDMGPWTPSDRVPS